MKPIIAFFFILGFALGAPAGYLAGEYNTNKQWQNDTIKSGVAFYDPSTGQHHLGVYQDPDPMVLQKATEAAVSEIVPKRKPDGIKLKSKAPPVVYSPTKGGLN